MSKEAAMLPVHEPVTRTATSRSSTLRTIMVSLVTCVLVISLFNYQSVLSTVNKGMVVCSGQVHGQQVAEAAKLSLEESSQTLVLPSQDMDSSSTLGKQTSFSLRRRSLDASELDSAPSTDGRSGYNAVTDGRSGYNRREETDGRSGYNAVTDGRSGYNRRDISEVDSSASTDGRSGYNRREETDGRSGYNSETDGRSGYNSVTDGRSGYNRAI
ncbi:hypothetical protein LX32DRAFT_589942 [Colletotrichum zoysiae]|uniref:Uncharacterized protein n=1 Tax=Colletotrichum zoysiae TaxID=1216348 RepID=A0AAD9HH76_9PEZI|nr:hypothetical protein LX32DRAFT_589942 [Colletotrichum zoysiae]